MVWLTRRSKLTSPGSFGWSLVVTNGLSQLPSARKSPSAVGTCTNVLVLNYSCVLYQVPGMYCFYCFYITVTVVDGSCRVSVLSSPLVGHEKQNCEVSTLCGDPRTYICMG